MSLSRCSCSKTLKFVTAQKGGARSFAEFTLSAQSEILRFAQNDSEGLRMTVQGGQSGGWRGHCLLPTAYCLMTVQGAERRVASLNQQRNGSITNR
jgi:hypothetical protein